MSLSISIIIPTLNEADNLEFLLPYLRSHGGDRISEIVIADGGSQDKTLKIATEYNVISFTAEGQGRGAQLKEGAERATGDILYFVHADSIPPESYAEDILKSVSDGIEVGTYRFKFRSKSWILKINSWFTRFDKLWCRGGDQTLFITRKLYDKIGGFDKDYVVMEDYDILLRARKNGNFRIVPKDVMVSARKYDHNSILRVNIANLIVFNMFRLGYSPIQLHNTYQRLINHPKKRRY